jgi:hypothetical protein
LEKILEENGDSKKNGLAKLITSAVADLKYSKVEGCAEIEIKTRITVNRRNKKALSDGLNKSADPFFEKIRCRSLEAFARKERITKIVDWLTPGQIQALEFFFLFRPKYVMREDEGIVDLSFPDPSFIGAVSKYDLIQLARYGLLIKKAIAIPHYPSYFVCEEFEFNEFLEEDILPILAPDWEQQKIKKIKRELFYIGEKFF